MRTYSSVDFSKVKITGPFWHERLDTVMESTIPTQYDQLEKHNILDSLTIRPEAPPLTIPKNRHNFTTQIFWDSDVGKWVEAASYGLSHRRDEKVEAQIEDITDKLKKAQAPDGYLNCWYLQREPENRWTNLRDNHELYNAGHLLEGAVAYYRATGRDRLLKIMMRYMDHIAETFGTGEGQRRGYPGHEEIELALVKLYHATGEKKYLDLATYFVDERGNTDGVEHYFEIEREERGDTPEMFFQGTHEYSQSHKPVREQDKVVGHAVRAIYLYTAMADLAAEHDDDGLKSACEALWKDVTETRMYVTGGFGPSERNEGFTKDYDLPNETAYAETCASVAMVFWAARMLNLDLDGHYADILELALYNNSLAGLSKDGAHYFYDNKLDSDGSHSRWAWHFCPCCTMNVSRLVASVAGYFYGVAETEVAVHLYGGAETTLPVAGGKVHLKETSNYPWDGDIRIDLAPEEGTGPFTLSLRIPSWAKDATAKVNGEAVEVKTERGYLKMNRTWSKGDAVELSLPMPAERLRAHPDVRADAGKVALRRGPLVYCIEQKDNEQPVNRVRLPGDTALSSSFRPDFLGGITVIEGKAKAEQAADWGKALYRTEPAPEADTSITAVPYYIWANRGPNPMAVWIRE
ncbi:glycoside hydrolase family 127 protein [Pelagovum pacificum]|uniref:Glycoside hydrolase family 127 protein n=1 Tax=Pelagovum pacificum TaxID=2588711 RepID=A0A5C5GBV8_9RHOB|nr:beta-L-arabinofuranosidase domain-containing protein [Pelagovum pacificum]QQA42366.1 glycoside hydrolase family 127 protein [Pelagovum pacificum]TNY31450.1 glycoside hydrolase family 127 protein [Pelagovum pacificum]